MFDRLHHPKPQTQNPKLKTLNPKPTTLNPAKKQTKSSAEVEKAPYAFRGLHFKRYMCLKQVDPKP